MNPFLNSKSNPEASSSIYLKIRVEERRTKRELPPPALHGIWVPRQPLTCVAITNSMLRVKKWA